MNRLSRIILFLIIAALLLLWPGMKGYCQEESFPINASGNPNRPLSVDPFENVDGYSAVLYDINSGLPTSEANAMAQTSQGFIWIGSYAGLVRYDGTNFELLNEVSDIANVRALYVDSSDRLWVGTNDAGVFLISDMDKFKWDKSDGLESNSIRGITEGADGLTYVSGTAGVGTIDQNLNYTHIEDGRLTGQTVKEVRCGIDGLVYGISLAGDIFTMKDGKVLSFAARADYPFEEATTILPDPDRSGFLYIATEHYIYHGRLDEDFGSWTKWDIYPLTGPDSLEKIDGRIWICARTGIGRIEGGSVSILSKLPMNNSFTQILTDDDGNLWVSSSRQGILKIVPNQFNDLFYKYGIDPQVVNTTCMSEERLFVGTDNGLIVLDNGKEIRNIPIKSALTSAGRPVVATNLIAYLKGIRIRAISRDSSGNLWISTARDRGLIRYSDGDLMQFSENTGLISNQVRFVSECEDGTILVATNDGISVIKDNSVIRNYGQDDGLLVRLILTMTEGYNHEIIAGSDGDGIYIIGPEGLKRIGREDGLGSEVIMRIKKKRSGDGYWIITSNSLAEMTPDYQLTTIRKFPYANNYDLYENKNGDLWILGGSGIYIVSGMDLDGGDESDYGFLGIANGLPYVATANSYSALTEDGTLYISGNEGVVRVNIEGIFDDIGSIRLGLAYIDADGVIIRPDDHWTFLIPGNARKLTFYPYIINYSLIDPGIHYCLEGFDTEVMEVNRSDFGTLSYNNLENGSYKFLMTVEDPIAKNLLMVDYNIIKGKQLSSQAAACIFMDFTALFILFGLLAYSTLQRKRASVEDRLYLAIIGLDVLLAMSDGISFFLEGARIHAREFMIAQNTIVYIIMTAIPYLFFLFLDHNVYRERSHLRMRRLLYAVPCFLTIVMIIANIWTGWIFSIKKGNVWSSGRYDHLVFIPVMIYFLLCIVRLVRINKRLVASAMLILAFHVFSDIWFRGVSSAAFMFALYLVCSHITVMNRPLYEEES